MDGAAKAVEAQLGSAEGMLEQEEYQLVGLELQVLTAKDRIEGLRKLVTDLKEALDRLKPEESELSAID